MENDKNSILDMALGSVKERADYEMSRIIENIADVNTSATKKRQLHIVIDIKSDAGRQKLSVDTTVKSKIEPLAPISSSLYITPDENGDLYAVEMVPNIPGQLDISGEQQAEPVKLKLVSSR